MLHAQKEDEDHVMLQLKKVPKVELLNEMNDVLLFEV